MPSGGVRVVHQNHEDKKNLSEFFERMLACPQERQSILNDIYRADFFILRDTRCTRSGIAGNSARPCPDG
jgi:hypothetical protein